MQIFGDESGHVRNLIDTSNERECFVQAVIAGKYVDCFRCAKKILRNVKRHDEVRWYNLTDVQKRRMLECLTDIDEITMGIVVVRRDELFEEVPGHRLFQDSLFDEYDVDTGLMGCGYNALLSYCLDQNHFTKFTFEEFSGSGPSQEIQRCIDELGCPDRVSVEYDIPKQAMGIQSADCIAGALREQMENRNDDWLVELTKGNLANVTDEFYENVGDLSV